jgi:BASS family bile acid:Na+ symporter
VALLCLAFLRVDPGILRSHFTRPKLIVLATAWMMLAIPLIFAGALFALDLRASSEALFLALVLQAVAPPIISAPALAALMGLDAALSLATLITCMAVTPFTAPLFAGLIAGTSMTIPPVALGAKLFAMLAGSAVAAMLARRIAGPAWIERQKNRIDGLNVIAMFVFAVALMDGVAANLIAHPLLVLGLTAFSFALSLALTALTTLVMLPAGRSAAFALGLAAGSRNLGLMLAAAGGSVPELTWLYFALAQFPIYLLPQFLKPLARRIHIAD